MGSLSIIELPKGFPCSVEELKISKRFDAYPYYHSDAIIKNSKLTGNVNIESGWASKDILINFIKNDFQAVTDSKGQMTRFEITQTGNIEMVKQRKKASHVLSILQNLGSTQNMSNELNLMDLNFDFPKPVELVKYLIGFYCDTDSIILDSFAGSGTTAHAVLSMNKEDGGNRKFICVEMMDYADTITAERVKCVIDGYGNGEKRVMSTGGDFTYYELGEPLFDDNGNLNPDIAISKIREYIWYMETQQVLQERSNDNEAFLGVVENTAYYFYYDENNITTLNHDFLATIKTETNSYVIYADNCTLNDEFLNKHNIIFKKIPRDIMRL